MPIRPPSTATWAVHWPICKTSPLLRYWRTTRLPLTYVPLVLPSSMTSKRPDGSRTIRVWLPEMSSVMSGTSLRASRPSVTVLLAWGTTLAPFFTSITTGDSGGVACNNCINIVRPDWFAVAISSAGRACITIVFAAVPAGGSAISLAISSRPSIWVLTTVRPMSFCLTRASARVRAIASCRSAADIICVAAPLSAGARSEILTSVPACWLATATSISVLPTCTKSPRLMRRGSRTRSPLTKTPLSEPRSLTWMPPVSLQTTSKCLPEHRASSMMPSASAARPTLIVPFWRNGISMPVESPSTTLSANITTLTGVQGRNDHNIHNDQDRRRDPLLRRMVGGVYLSWARRSHVVRVSCPRHTPPRTDLHIAPRRHRHRPPPRCRRPIARRRW